MHLQTNACSSWSNLQILIELSDILCEMTKIYEVLYQMHCFP